MPAGSIGSHVVEGLLAVGHQVRALVHYNGSGRRGFLDELNVKARGRLEVVAGDVRDAHQMSELVQGVRGGSSFGGVDRHSLFVSGGGFICGHKRPRDLKRIGSLSAA